MSDSVNPNTVSIRSTDFEFLINPNEPNNDRYIGIVSNIIEFPANGIFSAIRSVPSTASTKTSCTKLVVSRYWLPRMAEKSVFH